MARKIKKKPVEKQSNEGKIILIATGIILAVIVVLLIIVAITQGLGNGKHEESLVSTDYSYDDQTISTDLTSGDMSEITDTSNTMDTSYMDSVVIDETKTYYADIDVKDYGKITVQLDYKAAPISTKNFIYLAQSGFYTNLTFHRIMTGFMIQGGDPLGNGQGGAANNIYGEFSLNGYDNPLSHTRGTIAMARGNDYNSASSQFFIVHDDSAAAKLDGRYAPFGHVTEGIEVVDKICEVAQPTDTNGTIPADQQPIINTITIRAEDTAVSSS